MCHVVSVLHYVAINRPLGWSSCEAEPPWPSERSFGENVGATGSTVRGRPGATASPGTVTSRVGRSTCGSWRDGRGELIYLSLHLLGGGGRVAASPPRTLPPRQKVASCHPQKRRTNMASLHQHRTPPRSPFFHRTAPFVRSFCGVFTRRRTSWSPRWPPVDGDDW